MSKHLYQHLETLWRYMQLDHQLQPADVIITMGSNDTRVAEHASNLYLQGLAPLIVFSGQHGRLTRGVFDTPEAERFAEVAIDAGVPQESILLEKRAQNSGENVRFSYELLSEHGIAPKRVILVHKPYKERRAYATFMKQWPTAVDSLQVTSCTNDFFEYLTEDMTLDLVIEQLLGDYERIVNYPDKGFQISQPIPEEVAQAYQALIKIFGNDAAA
ncbi:MULTISPECIES: YdcF family protein [Vibrio]|uniref:YdcF family protein n=2 Tax=Vibrio TaxID=662 RepID=A0A7X4LPF8_9VIBR|nr:MULTISPECIES: YdcF family protein [Vibrio]MBF9000751.1 YdcF family protein [Vibrio nitrifigilis]MZI95191.1 YdcF family protein [Vibrio eleionomae]